jgi:alkylation response protein AidB-like acyl-CoA dehydrogenase
MRPAFSLAEIELRDRIRSFLANALPPRGPIPEDGWIHGFDPAFSRRLGAAGFIGMTWPSAYGGAARNYVERAIVTEELLRAGAPTAAHWVGDRQIGPALLAHGTEEQKREIIPRIVRGELVFCLGMSEPGAGSDWRRSPPERSTMERSSSSTDRRWTSFAHQPTIIWSRTDPRRPPPSRDTALTIRRHGAPARGHDRRAPFQRGLLRARAGAEALADR